MEKFPQSFYPIRFNDCDPFGHLNNSKYIDYFLNAREDHLKEHYDIDLKVWAQQGQAFVVSAHEISDPVPAVEFRVRDFGQGIASEHLSRIFERFYRVDKARSRESGGTGLGLAIARHVVQTLGGTIRAESELNAGSTFIFTLPLAEQPVK